MIVVDKVIGNVMVDEIFANMLKNWEGNGRVERLRVDTWEAQKSRLRKRADLGSEVGINLDRGHILRHGDVLHADPDGRHMIMIEVEGRKVVVIKLKPHADENSLVQTAIKLGHLVGNQHWPLKVDGLTVYVPVVIAENVMQSVLRTHNLPGIEWQIEDADPTMDLPLVAPSLEDHVHAHPHQHGLSPRHHHDMNGNHAHHHG